NAANPPAPAVPEPFAPDEATTVNRLRTVGVSAVRIGIVRRGGRTDDRTRSEAAKHAGRYAGTTVMMAPLGACAGRRSHPGNSDGRGSGKSRESLCHGSTSTHMPP